MSSSLAQVGNVEAAATGYVHVRQPAKKQRLSRFALLAALPFALFMGVFGVLPLFHLLRMSLSDVSVQQGNFTWSFTGLENYLYIGNDPTAMQSVVASTIFVLGAVPLTIIFGVGLAVLVDRAVLLTGIARNMVLWPAVVTPVAISLMWLLILSPSIGALNKVLRTIGIPEQGWLGEAAGAMASVILVDVWHWTPLVFLLAYTAIRGIDTEIMEAAEVDGASYWQRFSRVMLPMIWPAIAAATIIRLLMSVKAFDEMFLLTHGGPGTSTTLVSLHIRNVFFDRLELGYGAAFSVSVVLLIVIIAGIAAGIRSLMSRRNAIRLGANFQTQGYMK
ncbi:MULTISPECIES: carbohydrate ABC transporter permease [unclassified Arthrobacter]|uniref:carbohydrate ABC transporter permease n=1 Tax=unclassified Arthrobacter TaxID=235627 RepID=UPI002551737B|nr:sugar ABC transporter permease [Arthrobacter sp. fls2-241-R2A-172]